MLTASRTVSYIVPAIGQAISFVGFKGIVCGVNHPRMSYFVRVTEISNSGTNKHIGQIVRRNFTIIEE
jgi:hypothetical protein